MAPDARWTPTALAIAAGLLYFTPWLVAVDGTTVSGFDQLRAFLAGLPALRDVDALADYAAPLCAASLPALTLFGLGGYLRGARKQRPRWTGAALFATAILLLWTGTIADHWPPRSSSIEPAGFVCVTASSALLWLVCRGLPVDDSHGIRERRRRDASVAFDIQQNRWRPLQRLIAMVVDATIILLALALWATAYFPEIAIFALLPIGAGATVYAVVIAILALRVVARRGAAARLVVDRTALTVVTGRDRGRYARAAIGGIYVPQHVDDAVKEYYEHDGSRHTLTLPVATTARRRTPQRPGQVFSDSRASVAVSVHGRAVTLARHLTSAQADELVRRLTIRLLD